jgi:hypothetical protein
MRAIKPRPKESNPLVKLRALLGSGTKAISVSRLAALVDIPAATLRSVEIGRRTFNPDLQKRMRRRGIEWQPKTKRWVFAYYHDAQLSLPLLESFRQLSSGGPPLFQDLDVHAIVRRIIALMQGVEPSAYRSLLLDLHDSLESFRELYKVDRAQEEFQQTKLWYKPIENEAGGQRLSKGYTWKNSPDLERLFDFSHWQKSIPQVAEQSDQTVVPPVAA